MTRLFYDRHAARFFAVLMLAMVLVLSACGQKIWASDEAIAVARYQHGGAAELTLVTIMNYGTNRGDHTALFINGSERILFDPAGSWQLPQIPERNDVHFGMRPDAVASFYLSHVRPSHYAVLQRLVVAPEVAEQAKLLALQAGPVPPARCAAVTSRLLRDLPGLGSIKGTFFPQVLMRDFAQIAGVQSYELHHDDPEIYAKVQQVQRPL